MDDRFYTSTETAQITGCTRRQLQYWREKGVLVPTVNTSGKGRNVYYSETDLLALTVMEYLLSIGLSFELCREALETLKAKESWLFDDSVPLHKMKRLMFLLTESQEQKFKLAEFDKKTALEAFSQGQAVIPFWGDRVRERLSQNLKNFKRSLSIEIGSA
ncbi:MAG: MerR family transcriptional regulator [Crinalium sp.]